MPAKFDKFSEFPKNEKFSCEYFVDLHRIVQSFGTYNFSGARKSLEHCGIKVDVFRRLLPANFEDLAILQYLEFGFPLGLYDNFELFPVLKNHSSSYEFFTHIDSFISNEVVNCGLTGPFCSAPLEQIMTSPSMTAIKNLIHDMLCLMPLLVIFHSI